MTRLIKPRRFPHREGKAYTLLGFRQRVMPHLREAGFTIREVEKLEELYFARSAEVRQHMDETGIYRNVRCCRLYRLARGRMKYDRKNKLFSLVVRSGMFYVIVDQDNNVKGFISPYSYRILGVLCMDDLK